MKERDKRNSHVSSLRDFKNFFFVEEMKGKPDTVKVVKNYNIINLLLINSLYMFRALICSSSGGTAYIIGIFCAYWLLPGFVAASRRNTHKIHQLYMQLLW
jgi:hypothetical protein